MQEKHRINTLLQDVQNAMHVFNARSQVQNVATINTNSPMHCNKILPVASSTSAPMTRLMDKRKDVSPVLEGEGPQRNLVVDPLERKIKCITILSTIISSSSCTIIG
ncbi:hypothetical protein ACSQ67_005592 [Phaseolus vulgaris]